MPHSGTGTPDSADPGIARPLARPAAGGPGSQMLMPGLPAQPVVHFAVGRRRSPGRCARVPSWDDARRRVDRVVERRGGNPSAAGAVRAIARVIGAADALSARGRGYGKEKV